MSELVRSRRSGALPIAAAHGATADECPRLGTRRRQGHTWTPRRSARPRSDMARTTRYPYSAVACRSTTRQATATNPQDRITAGDPPSKHILPQCASSHNLNGRDRGRLIPVPISQDSLRAAFSLLRKIADARATEQRWHEIDEVLTSLQEAMTKADAEAFRTAFTELEVISPDRANDAAEDSGTPAPAPVRDRLGDIVDRIGVGITAGGSGAAVDVG